MFKRAKERLVGFLKQGVSAQKLAQTVAIGLFLGTIPLLGTTSILCAFFSLRLKLNMAVIQAVNYLVYPLQLLLFIPFIRLGVVVFDKGAFNYTLPQIRSMIAEDLALAIRKLFAANMLGVAVWLILMPGICFLVYKACLNAFSRMEKKA